MDRFVALANESSTASEASRAWMHRARLAAEIRTRLREVSGRAGRALADARRRREEGQASVERELSRLESL
jgi:hypothetical protein